MTNFSGKVVLVTGAGSGIGRAAALRFAQLGAAVALADWSRESGFSVRDEIRETGATATFIETDVSDGEAVRRMVSETVAELGGLDIAFNNAGIAEDGGTLKTTEAEGERLIAVNLTGVWLCMRAEIEHMLTSGGGAIVNTASRVALVGKATTPVYSAAKHGVIGLTKSAAIEFASKGIRINAICPGFIRTELVEKKYGATVATLARNANPLQRAGEAEEVAEAAVWLGSPAASFVVGVALPVDGGATA